MTYMMPVHILAKPEDIAKRVIIAGDPARVEQVAGMLENPYLVNSNRGYITYTGYYRDEKVTIATHGVGAPSAAIVIEEMRMLGAEVIIRLGTTGALISDLEVGDIVIPTGASYPHGGSATSMYVPDGYIAAVPNPTVLSKLIEKAEKLNVRFIAGPVFSSDAFYAEDPSFVRKWASRGVVSVEMECAALFILGLLRRLKTGALLIVSNNLTRGRGKEIPTAEDLKIHVEKASKIVLESIVEIPVSR